MKKQEIKHNENKLLMYFSLFYAFSRKSALDVHIE